MQKRHIAAALVAAALTLTPALASDVAGLMKTQPVFSSATGKNMYDLERCMIEVDGPIMPHVYRQPDRAQRVLMVWDGGGGVGGVSAAVQIDGVENAKVTFWGREKVLRRIKPCLDLAYSK
ncbi:MAG: hypothetical protein QHC67_16225 [Sphingobium sp.]|uniref:hypothetical protein n=1 Tax=Sphingobium sp. TaxID=1912891 RepID=UPI0029A6A6DD|nr:hypothetical protein [Sphingobium sp.]MDX3911343.1 hypothetical protein [Sphingobium sp.]